MQGLMMQMPLLISSLIEHADRHHGDIEIVSRRVEGDVHRTTYRGLHRRARQMANALGGLGIDRGERVATLAWNGYRHMELYFAVSGAGSVLHTINPRLHPEQIAWIVNHAEDRALFFDLTFLPLVEAIAPHCSTVRRWVLMTDRSHMPAEKPEKLGSLICYEDLIEGRSDVFTWPQFDENTASSMCYTSGTTGHPKGVLYAHRSTILHTLASALPDALSLSARDVILPVVPMFHVNAWGLPYIAPMVGAKVVFPGPRLDGESLYELFESEGVTFSAGVPTVWQGLLAFMEANNLKFSTMNRTVIGGSACPPAMIRLFQDKYGVDVLHAWGMTEMSPLGTVCTFKQKHIGLPAEQRLPVQYKQGRALFGVDMKITDDEGHELPWDGDAFGDLLVRGPWVVRDYYRSGEDDPLINDPAGKAWFRTGDVSNIDSDGYMQITDRSKDVIKSGGEWISSIELENIAVSHPAVQMAACIAAPHPKWDERPLLIVVKKPNADVSRDELLAHYQGKVAKWQMPDDVAFVESLPLGATGKILKSKLREQFRAHRLPTA
ncbi:MAG TPA: 3-(methylthio)propionyl-CoA ligase [Burkholderiaceae bacterium]|nr:3-(methylthio)propionyl-CoA ligase [Burkholderiaceae bacterium]